MEEKKTEGKQPMQGKMTVPVDSPMGQMIMAQNSQGQTVPLPMESSGEPAKLPLVLQAYPCYVCRNRTVYIALPMNKLDFPKYPICCGQCAEKFKQMMKKDKVPLIQQ